MKTIFKFSYLLLFLLSVTLFSCSNDDDGPSEPPTDSRLVGSWELKKIRNTTIPRDVDAPVDENPILITFLGQEFSGRTSANQFTGFYETTNDNRLKLLNFGTTEVNDTQWGNQFYNALSQALDGPNQEFNFPYDVTEQTLLLEYDTDLFLYFEKLN